MHRSSMLRGTGVLALLLLVLAAVFVPRVVSAKAARPSHRIPARLTVRPSSVVQYAGTTSLPGGDFLTTVYGRGLRPNVSYTLLDSNTTCIDTLNQGSTTVTTDSNGRLFLPIQGGQPTEEEDRAPRGPTPSPPQPGPPGSRPPTPFRQLDPSNRV